MTMIARSIAVLSLLLALPLSAATADLGVYATGFIPTLTVDPGERFSLHFTVYSKGPDEAGHARLTVSLPDGATLISAQSQFGSCVQQGSAVICDAPSPFGAYFASTSLSIEASRDFSGGIAPVTASVTSDANDPEPANNVWSAAMATRRFLMVETDADDGPKSLRRTIETMNATCGGELPCKIIFSRDMTIEPLSPLPAITACNSGFDAGGAANAPLRVELRGSRAQSGSGLEVRANCRSAYVPTEGVTIRRLAIGGFPENGINVVTGERPAGPYPGVRHTIQECFIGTDNSGTIARPNGWRGIATDAPDAIVTIAFNTISGNARSGIAFWRVDTANVVRNRIGIGADDRPLPNGASGLFAANGDVYATENTIACNGQFGISTLGGRVANAGNVIRDNGELPIDLGLDGPSRAGTLRPPLLTDAFYDAAAGRTIIRGHLGGNNDESPQGGAFRIAFAASAARNARGFADAAQDLQTSIVILPNQRGDFDRQFEASVKGDFRGQLIVGFTSYALWPDLLFSQSSELSDAVVVH